MPRSLWVQFHEMKRQKAQPADMAPGSGGDTTAQKRPSEIAHGTQTMLGDPHTMHSRNSLSLFDHFGTGSYLYPTYFYVHVVGLQQ